MNTEFEDMREQLNILKEKLQRQAIVNDQIFRRSMKRSVLGINRRYTVISILCLLIIPYSYWAFVVLNGMSIYFFMATALMMLFTFGYTVYNGYHLNRRLMEKDMVEARSKVARAKKLDQDWLKIGIPMTVAWLSYFVYEEYRIFDGGDWKILAGICVISAAVGGAIGMKIHLKIQDEYEQILDEIDDFTKES